MKCIIGLGNIGNEYENTRHNIGFIMLDKLCNKYNIEINKKKKKCIYGEGIIAGQKVCLMKPTTYMNLSGEAIVEIMNWYKVAIEDILVIVDDIDLPFGTVRYRLKGSAGTHNGLRNIIANLKDENFARIKVGIENRKGVPIPLIDYVLQKFNKEELEKLNDDSFKLVEENVIAFLTSK